MTIYMVEQKPDGFDLSSRELRIWNFHKQVPHSQGTINNNKG